MLSLLLRKVFREADHPRDRRGRFTAAFSADSKGVMRFEGGGKVPASILRRLKELKVPPGWREIRLALDPKAEVLARGIDSKGRIVTRYSAAHAERASAQKFARLGAFHKARPKIMREVQRDVKSDDPEVRQHAAALLLIDRTGFRPGSDKDTKAAKQAYGATTLLDKHVTVKGNTLTFTFTGKKGVTINHTLTDPELAPLIKERLRRARGGRLFPDVSQASLLRYLRSRGGGKFKLKDFRTWNGTARAREAIKRMPKPRTQKELDKARKAVAREVSSFLGNTPTVALKYYINPAAFHSWELDP